MDWSKWRCRSSAIGLILTDPKSAEDKKAGKLGQTAKTYLKKCYVEAKYGRCEDFTSKYTDKGTLTQPDCRVLLSFLDDRIYKDNTEQLENEYLTGTPDFYIGESIHKASYVVENKSAWNLLTFMDHLDDKVDKAWEAQLQGYFALTGAKEGEVSICLVTAPESIILDEKKSLLWKMRDVAATDLSPEYLQACEVLDKQMRFEDIDPAERRIKYPISRNDEFIEKVYAQVVKCRAYLNDLENIHLNR